RPSTPSHRLDQAALAQPAEAAGERGGEAVDLRLGRAGAERDANDAAGVAGRHALGDEDVARLRIAGGARGTGGDGVALAVEREHEQLRADPRDEGEQVAR